MENISKFNYIIQDRIQKVLYLNYQHQLIKSTIHLRQFIHTYLMHIQTIW